MQNGFRPRLICITLNRPAQEKEAAKVELDTKLKMARRRSEADDKSDVGPPTAEATEVEKGEAADPAAVEA